MRVNEIEFFDQRKAVVVATVEDGRLVLPAIDGRNLSGIMNQSGFTVIEWDGAASDITESGMYLVTADGKTALYYKDGTATGAVQITQPTALQGGETPTAIVNRVDDAITASVKIAQNIPNNLLSSNEGGLYVSDVIPAILSSCVTATDYATDSAAGVVKVDGNSGIFIDPDSHVLGIKTGNGITINAQGELAATGTGDLDYATLRQQLGIVSIESIIASSVDSSVVEALQNRVDGKIDSSEVVTSVELQGNNLSVKKPGATASQIPLPVLASGAYVASNATIVITDTYGESAVVDMAPAISAAAHTHSNKSSLDKIGEDADGALTYNGHTVGGVTQFVHVITENDDDKVEWLPGDIAEVTHSLGTRSIINVLLQNDDGDGTVISYDNYAYSVINANALRICVPYSLETGTWTLTVTGAVA